MRFIVMLCISVKLVGACNIPQNFRIHASNPCATWTRLNIAWDEANKKMWLYGYWLEPVTTQPNPFQVRKIEDAGRLTVYEYPGASFQDRLGTWGAYFSPNNAEIHYAAGYAVDGELWDPLPHEVGHWLWWLERGRFGQAYINVGHGTPDDPYYQVYKAVGNTLYCPHPTGYGCRTMAEAEEGTSWTRPEPYEPQRPVEIEDDTIYEGRQR